MSRLERRFMSCILIAAVVVVGLFIYFTPDPREVRIIDNHACVVTMNRWTGAVEGVDCAGD